MNYEGIQATEATAIGHLIDDIGAHLEAGALQGFSLFLSLIHGHTRSHKPRKANMTLVQSLSFVLKVNYLRGVTYN